MVSLSHRCLASVLARPFGRGDLTELDSVRSWRNIQLPCGCGVSGTHLEIGDWGLLPVWGFQTGSGARTTCQGPQKLWVMQGMCPTS